MAVTADSSFSLKAFEEKIHRLPLTEQTTTYLLKGRSATDANRLALGLSHVPDSKLIAGAPPQNARMFSPITIHFDQKTGKPLMVEFPNQSRTGSRFVEPHPKLMEALLNNTGIEGGEFLARVSDKVAGTRLANHFDPAQALGKHATGKVPERLHEASNGIIDALKIEAHITPGTLLKTAAKIAR